MLSFLPDSHHWYSIFLCGEHAGAMLLAIDPLACVDSAVGPLESPLAFFDVVDKITFVLASIRPY